MQGRDHDQVSSAPDGSNEVAPDRRVVTQLLRDQVPHLAHLPVRACAVSGSSNWVFRLGDAMTVRLPRAHRYEADLLKEVRWLPHIASRVATPVPEVEAVGEASQAFPRPWAVLSWLPGEPPQVLDEVQQARFAETLGAFLQDLHSVDSAGVPHGPEHWGYRCGEPVTDEIDGWVDEAATALADVFAPSRVREAWDRLRRVPPAAQAPCWVHTDLSAENVLVHGDGRLAGVIDFGGLGVGDPSVDLLYAWSLLGAPARELLRRASGADEGTWLRARAWAFVGPGLSTISSYRHSMPERSTRLASMVGTIATEVGVSLR